MSRINCHPLRHPLRPVCHLAFALTLIASGEGVAFAQDAAPTVEEIQTAERAFAAGREAFKNGSYTEAAEHFERADSNAPNDKVLGLAISSRDKAGHVDRAATLAQLGLEREPESETLQKLAEPLLEKAREELLIVTVECDEPCTLLDGTRIVHGAARSQRVIYLTPGKHTLRANWSEGRTESKPVEGEAGAETSVSFTAPEIPEEPEEPAPAAAPVQPMDTGPKEPPSGLDPLYFFIGAGVTAAVGGVAIWSGIDTLNNPGEDAVRDECSIDGPNCQDLYDEGKDKELRTNILLGATGVVGVTTIVLGIFTNWSGDSTAKAPTSRQTATIKPWLGVGDGAMVGANGRF